MSGEALGSGKATRKKKTILGLLSRKDKKPSVESDLIATPAPSDGSPKLQITQPIFVSSTRKNSDELLDPLLDDLPVGSPEEQGSSNAPAPTNAVSRPVDKQSTRGANTNISRERKPKRKHPHHHKPSPQQEKPVSNSSSSSGGGRGTTGRIASTTALYLW
mmetsp:Transcript_573/g.1697  ORF Transcript_573/g.1697 Transcript_573/m.1697 type:complete len:161 (-) Transcript_573:4879-5361(-)